MKLVMYIFSFYCSDSTLTVPSLLVALRDVTNWNFLGQWLDIPRSTLLVVSEKESVLDEWLKNHPAPTWKLVAWALYRSRCGQLNEHSVLKQLYGKHGAGMWFSVEITTATI